MRVLSTHAVATTDVACQGNSQNLVCGLDARDEIRIANGAIAEILHATEDIASGA